MTTPDAPNTPAMPGDQALADRAAAVAGYLTAAMLEEAGRPDRLPALLWPDADPELVQQIWEKAAAVCTLAARRLAGPRWDTAGLEKAEEALREAGWHAMARRIRAATACAPSQHPARGRRP